MARGDGIHRTSARNAKLADADVRKTQGHNEREKESYPASKFAVNGLTVSLARELGPKGIRVNAVAPGITETDMMKAVPKEVIDPMIARIPLRRLGQPEDIANAFVFLASDEASYITGVVLSVDGMART